MFKRSMAIKQPGIFLSQPPIAINPSNLSAPETVSMESAITSLEFNEYFIPGVPIEIPSDTVGTPKVNPAPLYFFMPFLTAIANLSICILHGVTSDHVEATPIIGFLKSSSLKPTALNIPLFGALASPSVIMLDFIFNLAIFDSKELLILKVYGLFILFHF